MREVDLHGLKVEEAIERVSREINDAILSEEDGLILIHGKGLGRLRKAVTEYCKGLSVVQKVITESENSGATRIIF